MTDAEQWSFPEVVIRNSSYPTILEYQVSMRFIDIINTSGDAVLPDDGLSKKFDFSDNLVGKVSKEVRIPVQEVDDRNYTYIIKKPLFRLSSKYDCK